MSDYSPDVWVVLKFTHKGEVTYKILAGWYGGYLGADWWKLSSGVTKVTKHLRDMPEAEFKAEYLMDNYSGSVYSGYESNYRTSGLSQSLYSAWVEKLKDSPNTTMEMLTFEQFVELFPGE